MADVAIVGAGIVGLSTAYWLRKAGHSVVVVEAGRIPNPHAASSDHHRLIRTFYGDRIGYTRRMEDAFAAWDAMWRDLPGHRSHYFADTQILTLSQEIGDAADRARETLDHLGMAYERIEGIASMAERFPFLEASNVSYALLGPGGALMADRIVTDLADWLRRDGTAFCELSPVTHIDADRGVLTLASGRNFSADRVVVSAGVGTGALLPDLDLPLVAHRTVILYADPPDDLRAAWDDAPCWSHLGGALDLWGMPPVEGLPLKLGNGSMGYPDTDDRNRGMSAEEVATMLQSYATRFRGADRYTPRWGQANYWTLAPNQRFLLQEAGKALVVSACSGHGFKFGALSGRDVADALTGTDPKAVAERMAPYP